jgi:two-component system response regulator RegX3
MLDCLVIDDDIDIASSICEYFNLSDIHCEYAADYETGMKAVKDVSPALILLDVNLGSQSGFVFCKKLREISKVPIIFLSARSADSDILMGLDIGGDDYITKPFSMQILLAKAKKVLQRSTETKSEGTTIMFGNAAVQIDRNSGHVLRDGNIVKLKPQELKLLFYMLDNPGRIITKNELLENVWEDSITSEGTLSVHIRRLREKLEEVPDAPSRIKAVWGSGYLFEDTYSQLN